MIKNIIEQNMNFIKCAFTNGVKLPPPAEYSIKDPKHTKNNNIRIINQFKFFNRLK